MESWHRPSVRGGCRMMVRDRDSPSFSSTLLDAIYRSIDQGEDHEQQGLVLYRETMRRIKKTHCDHQSCTQRNADNQGGGEDVCGMASLRRRAAMIEKWMENKDDVVCRNSSSAAVIQTRRRDLHAPAVHSFSSSSSESSCGSGFSSSETDSATRFRAAESRGAPKPIRTTVSKARGGESRPPDRRADAPILHHHYHQKAKRESGFAKTKSKALKMYGDLKKAKQPISPGAKLSSFINSLFAAGNAKSKPASNCSSASSFSRSCLSKAPSAVGKFGGGCVGGGLASAAKRSVRFAVDEGSRRYGRENRTVSSTDSRKGGGEGRFQVREEEKEAAAASVLLKTFCDGGDESDDGGDGASCASSDLFELDNLSSIGIGIGMDGRYREELPVYETTQIAPLPID